MMNKLRATDWTAIKWYMKEFNFTIKDLAAGPIIRFRNKKNEVVDINIFDIKAKYVARPRKVDKNKTGA